MKKRLYVLLALGVMTTVLLTACASSAGNTSTVATENSAVTEADSNEEKNDVQSDDSEIPTGNQQEGNWVYEVTKSSSGGPGGGMGGMPSDMGKGDGGPSGTESGNQTPQGDGNGAPGGDGEKMEMPGSSDSSEATATILWGNGGELTGNVTMIPATLGGYKVTVLGNGAQNITANNKNEDTYVLIPDGVTTLSARMIYDYNTTSGWSIPSSVTTIDDQAFLSSAGTFYGESGSEAESFAEGDSTRDFTSYDEDGSVKFTISAGENGYIQPNGTYTLPSGMLDGKHSVTLNIVSDYQYKIASLIVDGEEVTEAVGQNEYDLDYTFTTDSQSIEVTFEEDPDDSRDPSEISGTYDYEAPEITEGAASKDADTDDESLYEYCAVNTGSTEKYANTVGISTGEYYSANGKLYKMVYSSQATDEPEYYSKAEAINGVYEKEGLVYGEDYDLVRVYNYCENVTSGPEQGIVSLYCTYLYKEISEDEVEESDIDTSNTNTASIFAQEGAELTLNDFVSKDYTSSVGPSEAGNFFCLGSSIHVDGGDIFSCSSGGHGPYVSTGGQIYINTEDTNIVNSDGTINRDVSTLTATNRPSSDLGTMTRNSEGKMEGVFKSHDEDQTVIVTGDEAGTALATDTGGGVIVANQVTTKTFGLRCAGVYSIGSNESWVYCYNSSLKSYLDAGLTSASGGYIFVNNCDISGVMGMKTRGGSGSGNTEETGIHVYNSRIQAEYDDEEMQSVYDVASPDKWDDSILDQIKGLGATAINQLNIFLDKANDPAFIEDSLTWWFTDKSKTPGYSGGNKFAVIYAENSSTPITVEATQLKNKNYEDYGDASKLSKGQTAADNLLVSVEGSGAANITFTDENSSTKWDKTGEDDGTCEMIGDFYIGEYSSNESGSPDIGTGANSLTASFVNSEWEGTILYGDDTGKADLTFDADSTWTVTSDTSVDHIEVEDINSIKSDKKVTITYTESDSITPGTYGNVTFVQAE